MTFQSRDFPKSQFRYWMPSHSFTLTFWSISKYPHALFLWSSGWALNMASSSPFLLRHIWICTYILWWYVQISQNSFLSLFSLVADTAHNEPDTLGHGLNHYMYCPCCLFTNSVRVCVLGGGGDVLWHVKTGKTDTYTLTDDWASQTRQAFLCFCFLFFFSRLDFEQISNFCFAPLQHFQTSALVVLIKVETGCWGENNWTEKENEKMAHFVVWRGERATILHIKTEKKCPSIFKDSLEMLFSVKIENINSCPTKKKLGFLLLDG